MKNDTYAVLTGDLIQSSKLEPGVLQETMQALRTAAEEFNAKFPDSIVGKLDVFSGDGWQLLIPDWRRSIRAALYFRAVIKGHKKLSLDTRIAIAWGEVDASSIKPGRISESTGQAFTMSGRALSEIDKRDRMVLRATKEMELPGLDIICASVSLLDEIAGRWTSSQARTMAVALFEYTQKDIASKLGVTQPTVNQALTGSGWGAINSFLSAIEKR